MQFNINPLNSIHMKWIGTKPKPTKQYCNEKKDIDIHSHSAFNDEPETNLPLTTISAMTNHQLSQVSDLGGQQQAAIIVSIMMMAGVQWSYSAQLINTSLLLLTPDPAVKYLNINPFYLSSSPENSL